MERYRTTLVLVVVLVVLALTAIFLGKPRDGGVAGSPTAEPLQYIWQDQNPVTAISVLSGTNEVTVSRDAAAASWAILKPTKEPADTFQIEGLASSLQNLQASAVLTSSGDLAPFGLSGPKLQVSATFSDTARTQRHLMVGSPTFDGAGYYVMLANEPTVYIVTNTTIEPLKSWLLTPPKAVPTATSLPITIVPGPAITATGTVTGGASLLPTVPVSVTTSVTNTVPGAANSTTPVSSPALPGSTPTK